MADSARRTPTPSRPGAPRVEVLVATPLASELVARIRRAVPQAVVRHDAATLPPPRYACDHRGLEGFVRSHGAQRRWDSWLDGAEVLFGVPGDSADGLRETVRRCPRLRWIQGTAAGVGDMLRSAGLDDGERARVRLTSAAGVHAGPLAEWAMLGLLALTKDLPALFEDKERHRWDKRPVRELAGQHLVVVGLGQVGRRTAEYARALGMRVTGVRRRAEAGPSEDADAVAPVSDLPELFAAADAVVLALPQTEATRGLVDRALLERLPAHAILVNVGRGSVIDEEALIDLLSSGRLAGAALDVVATEPLPDSSRLWQLRNVILSPHTAALSTRENDRIVDLFIDNMHRFLAGRPLLNEVDPQHYY
jgi:glyoxylate/hydroxypyruvate reductase